MIKNFGTRGCKRTGTVNSCHLHLGVSRNFGVDAAVMENIESDDGLRQ